MYIFIGMGNKFIDVGNRTFSEGSLFVFAHILAIFVGQTDGSLQFQRIAYHYCGALADYLIFCRIYGALL